MASGKNVIMSLCVVVALLLIGCAGNQKKVQTVVNFNEPHNPCPEYHDLLTYPDERVYVSAEEEVDREVCLINWLWRYKDLKIWGV